MTRRWTMVLGAVVVLVITSVFLRVDTGNPPGFYRDESNIALNASRLGDTGRDEHGALLPLYFESHGDWKSAPYVYLLAAVFRFTGPSELAARSLSAVLGLAAVAVLGVLALRLTGDRGVALSIAVLAAATPWLFEVTRLVFEVALQPLLVALLLLLLAHAREKSVWSGRLRAGIGITLALIAYAYAGGRALAPLLALLLVVFATGERRRSVLVTWGWFAAALVPMAMFVAVHPRALFVRFGRVNDDGSGPFATVQHALQELNLVRWVLDGDDNLRHHVGDTGSLLAGGVLLAIAGAVVLVRRRQWDAYWSYVALGFFASVVPAAISDVRLHTLRSVAMPVFLVAMAIPAIAASRAAYANRPAQLAGVIVVALVLGQAAAFHIQYADEGPQRETAFHAAFPSVSRAALAAGPVAVYRNDADAMGNATWYAELWDERVEVIEDHDEAAPGDVVVAVRRTCGRCEQIAERDLFVAYIAR